MLTAQAPSNQWAGGICEVQNLTDLNANPKKMTAKPKHFETLGYRIENRHITSCYD
jgi:hypothetical protein